MVTIKVFAKTHEIKTQILESVLNVACVAAMRGYIPTNLDKNEPQITGRYWWREGDKFHLYGMGNNHWAFVRDEDETHTIIEFMYRYEGSTNRFCGPLAELLIALFPDNTIICE